MESPIDVALPLSTGTQIINSAEGVKLNPGSLYEAVIDLASEGLITARCINLAAGILLEDLGLPDYFFENITRDSLKHILASISRSIQVSGDRVVLRSWVADMDFDVTKGSRIQRVRIATRETRDSMESLLDSQLAGHRREYYFNPEKDYYTYVFRPEAVTDFSAGDFRESPFLFSLEEDCPSVPLPTRQRYEQFLVSEAASATPLVEVFNLADAGEVRLMFKSDFEKPQLQVLRKLFQDHGLVITRAY